MLVVSLTEAGDATLWITETWTEHRKISLHAITFSSSGESLSYSESLDTARVAMVVKVKCFRVPRLRGLRHSAPAIFIACHTVYLSKLLV